MTELLMTNQPTPNSLHTPIQVLAVVLFAGGQSRRMGQAKAMLPLPTGQTLLDFHIEQGLMLKVPILIADNGKIADNTLYHHYIGHNKVYHVADYLADSGALSALAGAMQYYNAHINQSINKPSKTTISDTGYMLVSSCDSLIGFDELYQCLTQALENTVESTVTNNTHTDAIYFYDDNTQQDYPLLGLYSVSLLNQLMQRVDNKQLSVMKFLQSVNCKKISLPTAWHTQVNFNTPIEFETAIQAKQDSL